jgi:hypothetical protein
MLAPVAGIGGLGMRRRIGTAAAAADRLGS